MLKAICFALLSCITTLTCSFVSAQTQPDVCKDAPSQADWNSGTSPVYAEANALSDELKSHGVEVQCIRRSKQENIFEGQKGAAWFQSKLGIFEVLFLPSGKDFSALTITEKQSEGLTTYSFSGNPKFMLKSMQSVKHLRFIKHRNFLFEVLENDPLTVLLKSEFEARHMDNQEQDPFQSAYDENGKVKPVTAAALRAVARMEREMAVNVEQIKASQPDLSNKDKNRGFAISQDAYKATPQDEGQTALKRLRQFVKNDGLVFHSKRDGPLTETTILTQSLHPAVKQLGLPKAGMYAFRRGCNRRWELANVSAAVVRQQMGHTTADMTGLYTGEIPIEQVTKQFQLDSNGAAETA